MAGYPCDVKNISKFCKNKGLTLIEDCAHAVGTKIDNKHVETLVFQEIFHFIQQSKLLQAKVEL